MSRGTRTYGLRWLGTQGTEDGAQGEPVTATDHPATRWTVAAVGVALLLTATVSPLAGTRNGQLVHLSLSAVLAIGVIGLGGYLARSPVSTRAIQHALGLTVAGALALAAAGAWTLGMHPVTAETARSVIRFDLVAGALSGSLVGTMYAHSRHRADLLAEERERLSFLNYLLRHNVLNGVQVVTGQTQSLRTVMPDEAEPRIDVIESWTMGLGDLVGRMRQFLDASTGDQDLQAVPIDTVLSAQVEKVEGAFDATISVTGSTPEVTADDGLNQVFECLLVDAVERSEAKEPTIDVTTSQRGPTVHIEVATPDPVVSTDGGASFEPDTQGDPAGDLGFGRYLVATLIDYYGGSVDIGTHSDDVLYTIELPHAQ